MSQPAAKKFTEQMVNIHLAKIEKEKQKEEEEQKEKMISCAEFVKRFFISDSPHCIFTEILNFANGGCSTSPNIEHSNEYDSLCVIFPDEFIDSLINCELKDCLVYAAKNGYFPTSDAFTLSYECVSESAVRFSWAFGPSK